jgi:hypothetical protein
VAVFLGSYAFLDITPKGRDETINAISPTGFAITTGPTPPDRAVINPRTLELFLAGSSSAPALR